jgi:hypothetical protein
VVGRAVADKPVHGCRRNNSSFWCSELKLKLKKDDHVGTVSTGTVVYLMIVKEEIYKNFQILKFPIFLLSIIQI